MSDEIGAGELVYWMAYASIEPFGQGVEDFRAGLAPAMHRNLTREKDADAIMPLDFYPWHREKQPETKEPQTPEELAAAIRARIFHITD